MGGETNETVVFACAEEQQIERVRLVPVFAQQAQMLAVCLQGTAKGTTYFGRPYGGNWSEVFLHHIDSGQRQAPLPVLTAPQEFVASPGPGPVTGLTFVVPGAAIGADPKAQAIITADLAFHPPAFSYPVIFPPVKNAWFEDAVDLHGVGISGIALCSPNCPPMIRATTDGWRMLTGGPRPRRLYVARPNILIGVGVNSAGESFAVAWAMTSSPYILHSFGGRKDVTQVAVSTAGDLVAVAGREEICIHRPTGEEAFPRIPVHGRLDAVLVDDTSGGVFVVCVFDSGIEVWDVALGKAWIRLPAVGEPVLEARFVPSATGPRIALATPTRVLIRALA